MILAPIIVIFAGYTAASYGYILMRSWEIPFRAWISPLHSYQWPADGSPPPQMPEGQLWPGGAVAPGTLTATPPAGVSPGLWAQIRSDVIPCLLEGGFKCIPGSVGTAGSNLIKKLFGI